jgi:hypothetical protein
MSVYDNTLDHPMTIYIDSSERVSGTDTAFISAPILLSASNSYNSVVVSQVSIPKSWYNVPGAFNYFTLVENGTEITITIPAGNYNRNSLVAVLPALMTAASTLGKSYTMSYPNVTASADTGKYTFSYTPFNIGGQTISIKVNGVSMFQQLGFDRFSTNTFNNSTGKLVSANVINFQLINSIYITSDMCVEEGVLQELHNVGVSQSNAFIFFQQYDLDLNSKQLLTHTNNSWHFSLTDQFERDIDLNGVPWSMSLIVYKRDDLHQVQKENLKIKNLERMVENELKVRNFK